MHSWTQSLHMFLSTVLNVVLGDVRGSIYLLRTWVYSSIEWNRHCPFPCSGRTSSLKLAAHPSGSLKDLEDRKIKWFLCRKRLGPLVRTIRRWKLSVGELRRHKYHRNWAAWRKVWAQRIRTTSAVKTCQRFLAGNPPLFYFIIPVQPELSGGSWHPRLKQDLTARTGHASHPCFLPHHTGKEGLTWRLLV